RTEAHRRYGSQWTGNATPVGSIHHLIPSHFFGNLGRDGIDRSPHRPTQRHFAATEHPIGILGLPDFVLTVLHVVNTHELIGVFVAWRHTSLQRREIGKRFERRTRLSL